MTLPVEQMQTAVASIFISYFNRAPEFEAMDHYTRLFIELLDQEGDSPTAEPDAFKKLSAQIYLDGTAHGEVPSGPTVTDVWYVTHLYRNILGREPDEEGLAYWTGQLESGALERPELVALIIDAAMNDSRDAAYVNNRTEVAIEFSSWENSRPSILDDLPYNAAEVLEGVNETRESVEAAREKLYSAIVDNGDSVALTDGVDYASSSMAFLDGEESSFRFTDKSETVLAAAGTLQTDDVLLDDSQDDNDTLQAYFANAQQVTDASGVTLKNIEQLDFTFVNAAGQGTFSFANVEGAKTLNLSGVARDGVRLATYAESGLEVIDASRLEGFIVMSPGATVEHGMVIKGGSGNDVIIGSASDDLIDAGEGNNQINAGAGNNIVNAGAGDDTIRVGDGDNVINAGDGSNEIFAGRGNNHIVTGEGNDTVTAGNGDNIIAVGEGDNIVTVGRGDNEIYSLGRLTLTAGGGNNWVEAADGDHVITITGDGDNVILLEDAGDARAQVTIDGDGDNEIEGGKGTFAVSVNGDGDNVITLDDGDNTVEVGDGDNMIVLGNTEGVSLVKAGDGDNYILGGTGEFAVEVGGGDNTITLGDGDNDVTVNGGGDNDIFLGDAESQSSVHVTGDGFNVIVGGKGRFDVEITGNGDNVIELGDGDNEVTIEGAGDNEVITGAGEDTIDISKGDGNNYIDAGAGDDEILVGDGENVIIGGEGADEITLRAENNDEKIGANLLVFALGDSKHDDYDVINNFVAGKDKLSFGLVAGTAANTAIDATSDNLDYEKALLLANDAFDAGEGLFYVIVTDSSNNANNWVYVDYDGDGTADLGIEITLLGGDSLSDANII